MLGWQDATLLAVAAFFLFGAQQLPATIKGMGQAVVEFKKGVDGTEDPPPQA